MASAIVPGCHDDRPRVPAAAHESATQRLPFAYAAWLVDFDGTLYRQDLVRAMMAIELATTGWRDIRTLRVFRREHERLRGEAIASNVDPYLQQIHHTALRLAVSDAAVQAAVERWMIARPARWLYLFRRRWLLRAIAAYRAGGGKTALVSDYPARRKVAAIGAANLFDVVVACGDVDAPCALKPHPAGLLQAAERLGVSPDECLVIGDRLDADGAAARRAGMAFQHVQTLAVSCCRGQLR